MKFILASSSPRRKELLKLVGIYPQIIVPMVEENRLPQESIDTFLRRISIAKGKAVFSNSLFETPIISADTIVVCENQLIGKPQSREDARKFLKILAGKSHDVLTGIAILYRGHSHYEFSRTQVLFSPISDIEIEYYLDNEDFMDKAGAYAIQGKAAVFVKEISGCYFNVMGFPINLFYSMLKKIGISIYN